MDPSINFEWHSIMNLISLTLSELRKSEIDSLGENHFEQISELTKLLEGISKNQRTDSPIFEKMFMISEMDTNILNRYFSLINPEFFSFAELREKTEEYTRKPNTETKQPVQKLLRRLCGELSRVHSENITYL